MGIANRNTPFHSYEISSLLGGENVDRGLLSCDAMYCTRCHKPENHNPALVRISCLLPIIYFMSRKLDRMLINIRPKLYSVN
jgi:hypothetical protein